MKADPVPALGYIRVNSAQLTKESDSQRSAIEAWAACTGHIMVGWVEDVLVDGAGRTAEGLGELVGRVAAGDAVVVAAASSVRIARRLAVVKAWAARVRDAGGRLVIVPVDAPHKRTYRG
jgi:DNA invertase Pin-like site-specific DNA recombinase